MIKSKTFMTGRSQAIRLPKEFRFPDEDIFINKIDNVLMVVTKDIIWDVFDSSLDKFSEDFMQDRGLDLKDKRNKL